MTTPQSEGAGATKPLDLGQRHDLGRRQGKPQVEHQSGAVVLELDAASTHLVAATVDATVHQVPAAVVRTLTSTLIGERRPYSSGPLA